MIFDKILEIYRNYYLCPHCLGRMFSLLGTNTTNQERGNSLLLSLTMENHSKYLSDKNEVRMEALDNLKILSKRANFLVAKKVLEKEGIDDVKFNSNLSCYLCSNLFSNFKKFTDDTLQKLENIEFNTFLVGSTPNAKIINREDKFKAEFNLLEAESFKSHFNRVIGKELMIRLNKNPEFINPDLVVVFSFDFDSFKIELILKSLFIYGKYNKLIRGIPQTHWTCKNCRGKGCKDCNFTGKRYLTSIEELISEPFLRESYAIDSKFHGAGREDIDVRMLGEGRPFILELRNPKVRTLDLIKIEKEINKTNKKKVHISNLKYTDKKKVIYLKAIAEKTRKIYKALVKSATKISKQTFEEKLENLKEKFEKKKVRQRTPTRVSHRRADKVREKFIYEIKAKRLNSRLFEFIIETQGGTYIKELVNGDQGRTKPSFSEIFDTPLECKELDVEDVIF